jgi:hypothetical protein
LLQGNSQNELFSLTFVNDIVEIQTLPSLLMHIINHHTYEKIHDGDAVKVDEKWFVYGDE